MTVKVIHTETWSVDRVATIELIEMPGRTSRIKVSLADLGRKPFLVKWFNDESPARDFIDRVREGMDPREDRA